MDPVTQGVLGAAAAQAVFARKLPRAAGLVGGLAGMAADLDIFITSATDPTVAWTFHRHFTHSLAFIPAGGLLCALPFFWFKPFRGARGAVLGAALVGYATHGLLDACTSYGTMLLWPFSDRRVAWDWIPIIDPLYTLPLIVGVVWAYRARRASPAVRALLLSSLYMVFGIWQHERAARAQESLARARGHAAEHARVMPMPLSLVLWRSLYITGGQIYVDGLRVPWRGEPRARAGGVLRRATPDELPPGARERAEVQRAFGVLEWFADGLVASLAGPAFGDMRFAIEASSLDPLWGLALDPAAPGGVKRWGGAALGDRAGQARGFWRALVGDDPRFQPLFLVTAARRLAAGSPDRLLSSLNPNASLTRRGLNEENHASHFALPGGRRRVRPAAAARRRPGAQPGQFHRRGAVHLRPWLFRQVGGRGPTRPGED
ncbi:MAG TPA: metal-dependent hydrolase [Blastocatellia bacterium]|nr:metal-dependent hydrolase [Blastocatellia bacterium]